MGKATTWTDPSLTMLCLALLKAWEMEGALCMSLQSIVSVAAHFILDEFSGVFRKPTAYLEAP